MVSIHWFRRDLRLEDNTALGHALNGNCPVLTVFIFDRNILEELPPDDARVGFIYNTLSGINTLLRERGSSLRVFSGEPLEIWKQILDSYQVESVFFNRDYEPYALERDQDVTGMLHSRGIDVHVYKDQVIFEAGEVKKPDGKPYTVFTPYKRRWLDALAEISSDPVPNVNRNNLRREKAPFPALKDLGFRESSIRVPAFRLDSLESYATTRDLPAADSTTRLGPHLRFGTISIRTLVNEYAHRSETFLSELIWREFFMQILYHFPEVVDRNFHRKYDGIDWRNDEGEFMRWCEGKTGYPLVDAGMRQLNATGFMHNRVRMVTASFLCKHLLIDWRWGEAYFAEKLLDFELASNNGNWQWAAGTGCDAAPYFRVFNPEAQLRRFDPEMNYVREWVPEYGTPGYPPPMVDHRFARQRALTAYRNGLL